MPNRGALWVLALVVFAFAVPARAKDLKYSRIDAATVRVFAYKGVDVERLEADSKRAYVLAIPKAGHGSGLIVGKNGLILTARHVIEDAKILAVQLPGSDRALPARVVYADEERDHAFLVVPGKFKESVEIPKKGPSLAVRDVVYVIGYPLDASRNHPQSQQGIVSGVLDDGSLQLGIALNPGNSGGPVVDADERLLGIAVARADPRAGAQGIGVALPVDHILPGYKRARESDALDEARQALEDERLAREAELLVELLTSEEAESSWRALSGDADAPANGKVVAEWLAEEENPSADALSLGAAELWNAAAAKIDRDESASAELAGARALAEKAAERDEDVTERSPFISFVLEDNEPTDVAAKLPGKREDRGVPAHFFDEVLDSLETSKALPMARIGPTVGITTPFQVIGIGVVAKMLFAERLSLQARYSFGWQSSNSDLEISHLFEALGGFAIGTWVGSRTTQLVLDVERNFSGTVYHYIPGKVPTVHTLIVEGGVLSGPLNLLDPDSMTPTLENRRQAFFLEGGVRYVYFYQAKSSYLATTARSTVELSGHLVAPPLNVPDGWTSANDVSISKAPGFKSEVGWGSAPLSWGLTELGVGYFPSGKWFFVRIGWTYLFY